MPTLRNLPIRLTAEQILRPVQRSKPGKAISPALTTAAEAAARIAMDTVFPAVVWEEWAVTQVFEGVVSLHGTKGRRELTIGEGAALLEDAHSILAAVWTIGSHLEMRVNELHQEGMPLLAFTLDTAGVLALGAVGEATRGIAEQLASARGWGVSPALSPGSLNGWPVWGQRELCALLPLEEIEVELSPFCVLQPQKSCSAVIGIGPTYNSVMVGSLCGNCALSETCWRRREVAE